MDESLGVVVVAGETELPASPVNKSRPWMKTGEDGLLAMS
jgi:hypothetical protein